MMFPVGDPSFGRSFTRVRHLDDGLPVQREVPSIRMDSQSFSFSEDLLVDCPSAGDRPVRVLYLPITQVLYPVPGSSSLEGGRNLLPVDRPSFVNLPSLFDPPHNLGVDHPGRSKRGSCGPLLAPETMVSYTYVVSGGTPQGSPS